MIILGVAISAIMRSFTVSLASIRKSEAITTGIFLAQQLLEQYEIELPEESSIEGNFGDNYPHFRYITHFEEIDINYKDVALESLVEDFVRPTQVTIDVYYDDERMKRFRAVQLVTYVTGVEKFDYKSKMLQKRYY
jgi:hypothetical protein